MKALMEGHTVDGRRHWLWRYAAAALLGAAAATLRHALIPVMGYNGPYLVLYPVVMAVAVLLGVGPGLLSAAIGIWAAETYLVVPTTQWLMDAPSLIRVGLIVLGTTYVGHVGQRLRQARRQAHREAEVARRSETQLRLHAAVIESAANAIVITDPSGTIQWVNPSFTRLTGYSASEAVGRNPRVLKSGMHPPEFYREMWSTISSGKVWRGEVVNRRKDGGLSNEEMTITPVKDANGSITHFVAIKQDVTERKQAEETLRKSEARVRLKLESILAPAGDISSLELSDLIDTQQVQAMMDDFHHLAPVPMSIIDMNGKLLVGVGWQKVCMEFHRTHPETCRHCLESDTQLIADLAPSERRLYKCKNGMWDMATPIFVGERRVGNIFSGQFFFSDEEIDESFFREQARRYGFNEEAYLAAVRAVPRMDRETANRAMDFFMKLAKMLSQLGYSNVHLARALVERDRLTASLRESESFYRQTLESIPGMVFTTRPDGHCDYQSQQWVEFTGVPMSEHLGDGWNRLLHPDDRPRAYEAWREAVEGRAPYDLEYRVRRRNGAYEWFKVIARPIRNAQGQIVRWFGVAVNVENLKHAETVLHQAQESLRRTVAELKRSNYDLEQFAYIASHDLQEPLRTMRGYLGLLEEDAPQNLAPEVRDYIKAVQENGERMHRLILGLLDYSRVDSPNRKVERVDMDKVLRETLDMHREAMEETSATVTQDPLPNVWGDATQLAQVLSNLIGNALKFHRKDIAPSVHVSASRAGSEWVFVIRDNGIGIDPKYHERIFQIFQRLHGQGQYPGSGLGLAISKKIIERHGGRVWVESQRGHGATFYFSLPEREGQT